MNLSKRLETVIESQTLAMTKLARELKEQGKDIISLSIGEPDFDTPKNICEAATKAMNAGQTHYTPVAGTLELRNAISQKLKRENHLDFNINEIIVSNGAKQSLLNAVLAIVNPGDEVLLPAPFWVSYPSMVTYAGGISVQIEGTAENNYKVTAEQLESHITDKTKLIMFSSPCNPSGSVMSYAELEAWVKVLEKHPNIFVLSDEIYEKINYVDRHYSIAEFPSMKGRVAVINGLSKGYAMTGWRIGYLAGPADLVKACDKIQGLITSGANSVAQAAGVEALNGNQDSVAEMKSIFEKRRNLMFEKLSEIEGLKNINPDGAFYHFPDVSNFLGKSYNGNKINTSDELCLFILEVTGVSIVAGTAFGSPNCIRLSYATSEDLIIESVSRISKALSLLN
jgi:aspartate aminotransferase